MQQFYEAIGLPCDAQAIDDFDNVPKLVDESLRFARNQCASDIHLRWLDSNLEMKIRVDGILIEVARFGRELGNRIITRLKVLAELLTYRTDVPQEGRIRDTSPGVETRISTFPTVFGEKAVVRLFADHGRFESLDSLGFPSEILAQLKEWLSNTSGCVLLTGPSGSGKTTTIYACLREILDKSKSTRSLVSLEDPVEVVVPGVDQSQIENSTDFNMEIGLRSLLRQDPEVIMVGEIRDRATAETVFQASLTGHLIVTTFHAGSSAQAISRLSDMGIEPYLLRSGLLGVVSQRLARQLCDCSEYSNDDTEKLGLPSTSVRSPVGCRKCHGTGYAGRFLLSEAVSPDRPSVADAILNRSESQLIHESAFEDGTIDCRKRAIQAIREGKTSVNEALRIFGGGILASLESA